MDARTLQLLEFPKVLQHLASFAVSDAGRNACLAIMPESDATHVRDKIALVRETMQYCAYNDLTLGAFPDVQGIFAYLANPLAFLDQDGLVGVLELLRTAALLIEQLAGVNAERMPYFERLARTVTLPVKTWSGLKRCLSADGMIRDEASPELYSVRQEIRRIHQMCTRKVQDFFQNKDLQFMLQDDFLTISADRYVLALKTNFKGRLKGIVHDYSQTGETCYFEPLFLVDLNNELQEYKQEERSEEQKILRFLTELIRSELNELQRTVAALVQFDVLLACNGFARRTDSQVVDVSTEACLQLRDARHPLLIFGKDAVVPVDIVLEKGQQVLVITGGNAGGKTVCLKTMGIIGLMAHAGLPVPAAEGSTLPFWNKYVISMGDEQSIEQSLSTFTAQIRHFSSEWPGIDEQTLVILDEFGVGTDPSQGAALAQAVVDGLLERKAWVGVATHFPALKAYGLSRDGVRAASVIFAPDSRKPLYRLGYDQVGASRALEVAKEQGLPESILAKAQEYLYLDSGNSEEIFDRLNRLAASKEEELAELEQRRQALEQKFAKKLVQFEQERSRVMTELRSASSRILQEWREGRRSRKDALKELSDLRESVAVIQEEVPTLSLGAIAQGQLLLYLPWNKQGLVCEIDSRKERIRLEIGGVSLWVGIADVQETKKAKPAGGQIVVNRAVDALPALKIDLRRLRTDEAEAELDRFLDKALLAGRTEVEIIHGMGTGAMRKAVHEHLRHSKAVKSFALATADEGGDGMTKVILAG